MRPLSVLVLLSALACTGGLDTGRADTASPDTGVDPAPGPDSGSVGPDDTAAPGATFWELGDPCSGGTGYALHFADTATGWVGCGSGMGLWATTDGGDTFASAHPASGTGESVYVHRIVPHPDGGLLICGHDYSTDPDPLLWHLDGGTSTVLLTYGANGGDPGSAQMANCGAVAAAGDGTLLVASDTVGDMTRSEDGGLTWTAEYRYWEDANLEDGGYAYYYMLELVAAGGAYHGAGSRIVEPPVFYGPSRHEDGEWFNFHASVVDASIAGEVWALATPDDGATWFVGGRDQGRSSEASGFFYRSDDGGETWTDISLGGSVDIMHDVAFADDGLHGIAVGHRYPPATLGGFVALTEDGGRTWTERAEEVPPLQEAAIVGRTFWVSGDGYLARGVFGDR